jgi:hypothetical protein
MERIVIGALLTLSVASGAAAQEGIMGRPAVVPVGEPVAADMSPEETLVRTAYAKFAYASEQNALYQLALEANTQHDLLAEAKGTAPKRSVTPEQRLAARQKLAAAQVSFKLNDFVIGYVADIRDRKASDLISPPIGEIFDAGPQTYGFSEGGQGLHLYGLHLRWGAPFVGEREDLNATIGELERFSTSERYASYSVTATFQGRSLGPYRALFVFGRDTKGNATVMPEDENTNDTALTWVLAQSLFPEALVRTRLRAYPVVAEWLNRHEKSCSQSSRDVCCDLTRLQCGPGSDDVAKGLSEPLPTPRKEDHAQR